MVSEYKGHYSYSRDGVETYAPTNWGVYYCGAVNPDGKLGTFYVGKACAESTSIKSRLLEHLNIDYWPDVTHFGYMICASMGEADQLEKEEIIRLDPKYNKRVG